MTTQQTILARIASAEQSLADAMANWNSASMAGTSICCDRLHTAVVAVSEVCMLAERLASQQKTEIGTRLADLREQVGRCVRTLDASAAFWSGMQLASGDIEANGRRHDIEVHG